MDDILTDEPPSAAACARRPAQIPIDHQHTKAWLRFNHSNLTAAQKRELVSNGLTPQALFATPAAGNRYALPGARTVQVDQGAVERDLAWAEGNDCHVLTLDHPHYPTALREIYDPPWLLYVRGRLECLRQRYIAIVGSRNPSAGGCIHAQDFAQAFGRCGWGVVSGLATGIDGAAHRGALNVPASTIAVLGTGPDQVYPRRHTALAAQIVAQGALVSEFPPGTPARRQHFPQRNRIISGLSQAVLVVEASLRSGSLITARLAADQGREVCAIPGSIHLPTARGCHRLIRQGAKLVECAQDVLEELTASPCVAAAGIENRNPGPTKDFDPLAPHLGYDPVAVDELIQRSGLTAEAVSSMLLQMEVLELVEALPGGRYHRIK